MKTNLAHCHRPVRFDEEDEAMLRQLKELSGLSLSSVVRRAVHYAAPRFLDGRVNLLTLQEGGGPLVAGGKGEA